MQRLTRVLQNAILEESETTLESPSSERLSDLNFDEIDDFPLHAKSFKHEKSFRCTASGESILQGLRMLI